MADAARPQELEQLVLLHHALERSIHDLAGGHQLVEGFEIRREKRGHRPCFAGANFRFPQHMI